MKLIYPYVSFRATAYRLRKKLGVNGATT
ncbi:uncharacterized protein METZ01_LOCUS251592 [marine metagenome]|uniref:Uncharacterized protein n=1 Tax=marine metagenome TaxID=408172 RepID=A0A382IGN5_9ZZZZ